MEEGFWIGLGVKRANMNLEISRSKRVVRELERERASVCTERDGLG